MKLLEYEAKALLLTYGLPVPMGQLVTKADESPALPLPLVVKVQIPTGGRGKAGGVRQANTPREFTDTVQTLLSESILGYRAKTLLAEEALQIKNEFYIAITVDRTRRSIVLLAHKHGGIEIESTTTQSEMLTIPLEAQPDDKIYRKLSEYFELSGSFDETLSTICHGLWEICVNEDALLVEINPLIATTDNTLICADAKIELDDAAAFRHPNHQSEQIPQSTQFVILNQQGSIGSMANGAGLAMATVDAIQATGATAANFLDVGGGTNTDGMVEAFRQLANLPRIKAIVVNIFGGITRCDQVAEAIVQARKSVPHLPPLFIRLTGTNESKGRAILESADVPVLPDLKSCVQAAAREVS